MHRPRVEWPSHRIPCACPCTQVEEAEERAERCEKLLAEERKRFNERFEEMQRNMIRQRMAEQQAEASAKPATTNGSASDRASASASDQEGEAMRGHMRRLSLRPQGARTCLWKCVGVRQLVCVCRRMNSMSILLCAAMVVNQATRHGGPKSESSSEELKGAAARRTSMSKQAHHGDRDGSTSMSKQANHGDRDGSTGQVKGMASLAKRATRKIFTASALGVTGLIHSSSAEDRAAELERLHQAVEAKLSGIESRIAELERRRGAGELSAEEVAELARLKGQRRELKQVHDAEQEAARIEARIRELERRQAAGELSDEELEELEALEERRAELREVLFPDGEAAGLEERIAELKRRQAAGELSAEEAAELARLEERQAELKERRKNKLRGKHKRAEPASKPKKKRNSEIVPAGRLVTLTRLHCKDVPDVDLRGAIPAN